MQEAYYLYLILSFILKLARSSVSALCCYNIILFDFLDDNTKPIRMVTTKVGTVGHNATDCIC